MHIYIYIDGDKNIYTYFVIAVVHLLLLATSCVQQAGLSRCDDLLASLVFTPHCQIPGALL